MKTTKTFDNVLVFLSVVFLYTTYLLDEVAIKFPEVVHHRGSIGPTVVWDYYTTGDVRVVSIVWHTNFIPSPTFHFSTQTLHTFKPAYNPHEPRW